MVGDEMSEKLVAVSFRSVGKLTGKLLKALLGSILKKGLYQMTSNKKSLTAITGSNRQTAAFEVDKSELAGFDKYAKRYHFEYSIKREKNDKDSYMFIFQAKDWDKLETVTRDYVKDKTVDRSSFENRISEAKDKAFQINKTREQERTKERTHEHTKSKSKEKVVER